MRLVFVVVEVEDGWLVWMTETLRRTPLCWGSSFRGNVWTLRYMSGGPCGDCRRFVLLLKRPKVLVLLMWLLLLWEGLIIIIGGGVLYLDV